MQRDEKEILSGRRRFLEIRSLVLRLIRAFFESEGFLEVQTPLLTGAPAPKSTSGRSIPIPAAFLPPAPNCT